jgi:hypothetical protein
MLFKTLIGWIVLMSASAWCAVEDGNADLKPVEKSHPQAEMTVCLSTDPDLAVTIYSASLQNGSNEIVAKRTVVVTAMEKREQDVDGGIDALENAIKILKQRIAVLKEGKKAGKKKLPKLDVPEPAKAEKNDKSVMRGNNPFNFPPPGQVYENPDCRTGA